MLLSLEHTITNTLAASWHWQQLFTKMQISFELQFVRWIYCCLHNLWCSLSCSHVSLESWRRLAAARTDQIPEQRSPALAHQTRTPSLYRENGWKAAHVSYPLHCLNAIMIAVHQRKLYNGQMHVCRKAMWLANSLRSAKQLQAEVKNVITYVGFSQHVIQLREHEVRHTHWCMRLCCQLGFDTWKQVMHHLEAYFPKQILSMARFTCRILAVFTAFACVEVW